MTHIRQVIREAVLRKLEDIPNLTNIYSHRVIAVRPEDTPAVSIYTVDESITPETLNRQPLLERIMTLSVECWVSADPKRWGQPSNIDNELDNLISEVEQRFPDETQLEPARVVRLATIQTGFSDEGDRPVARAELQYRVKYRCKQGAPTEAC